MHDELDLLEQRLLNLGQDELRLEHKIRDLQIIAREAGRAGRLEESDAAWELREQLRTALAVLLTEITEIERVLYPARLRKRQP